MGRRVLYHQHRLNRCDRRGDRSPADGWNPETYFCFASPVGKGPCHHFACIYINNIIIYVLYNMQYLYVNCHCFIFIQLNINIEIYKWNKYINVNQWLQISGSPQVYKAISCWRSLELTEFELSLPRRQSPNERSYKNCILAPHHAYSVTWAQGQSWVSLPKSELLKENAQ